MDELKVGKWYWIETPNRESSFFRKQINKIDEFNVVCQDGFGIISVIPKSRFVSESDSRPFYLSEVGLAVAILLAFFLIGRSSRDWH